MKTGISFISQLRQRVLAAAMFGVLRQALAVCVVSSAVGSLRRRLSMPRRGVVRGRPATGPDTPWPIQTNERSSSVSPMVIQGAVASSRRYNTSPGMRVAWPAKPRQLDTDATARAAGAGRHRSSYHAALTAELNLIPFIEPLVCLRASAHIGRSPAFGCQQGFPALGTDSLTGAPPGQGPDDPFPPRAWRGVERPTAGTGWL